MCCRNGLQKVLGVLISVAVPVGNVLSARHWSVGASILISLQVFVGSAIVIYLDEALRKGYGLLSGIPLCTTANVW